MQLTAELEQSNARILAGLQVGAYDFLDLGSNDGGGFKIGQQLGGQSGVGFELDPGLAQWNIDHGRDVMCLDVRTLPTDITGIRFAVCSHVLEHLPNLYDVGSVISALARVCQDYLLIYGPNFDSEEFLYAHNLKVLHSAMRDHLCKFRTIELMRLLFDLGLRDYVIGVSGEMRDSANIWIHRSDAPADGLWTWEESKSLPKPFVKFEPPLHRDFVCVVRLQANVDADEVLRHFFWGCDQIIVRSSLLYSQIPLSFKVSPPTACTYHTTAILDLQQEPERFGDCPSVQPFSFVPPAILEVPPLSFGDTDMSRTGIVCTPPGNPGAQRLESGGPLAFLLRNAIVHGNYGVITLGDRVVKDTLAHFPVQNIQGVEWGCEGELRLPLLPLSAEVHAAYHLVACNQDNYFHWLVGIMARFRPLDYEVFGRDPATKETPILLVPQLDSSWKRESLSLSVPDDLPRMSLTVEGRVFVHRLLYIPDLSGGGWNPHPAMLDAFNIIRARVMGAATMPRPWRRLYISRVDSSNRVLINEAEVIGRAERAGFSPITLSEFTVSEQVRLFAEATHILAPHGAGLTNIVFCQAGAVLCELHMDSYVHWGYRRLAALRGMRYGCLVGTTFGERMAWAHSNTWCLDIASLEGVLADSNFTGAPSHDYVA